MARIIVGNSRISGFVNHVADGRLVVGTGSFQDKDDNKVFKESISVFLHEKFNGTIPAKGEYVTVEGDLNVSPRKDDAEKLNATMNIRFANQLVKTDAPQRAEAPAPADDI